MINDGKDELRIRNLMGKECRGSESIAVITVQEMRPNAVDLPLI